MLHNLPQKGIDQDSTSANKSSPSDIVKGKFSRFKMRMSGRFLLNKEGLDNTPTNVRSQVQGQIAELFTEPRRDSDGREREYDEIV